MLLRHIALSALILIASPVHAEITKIATGMTPAEQEVALNLITNTTELQPKVRIVADRRSALRGIVKGTYDLAIMERRSAPPSSNTWEVLSRSGCGPVTKQITSHSSTPSTPIPGNPYATRDCSADPVVMVVSHRVTPDEKKFLQTLLAGMQFD